MYRLKTIKIDALENINESIKLYIKDNLTGETYQINNKNFEINCVPENILFISSKIPAWAGIAGIVVSNVIRESFDIPFKKLLFPFLFSI